VAKGPNIKGGKERHIGRKKEGRKEGRKIMKIKFKPLSLIAVFRILTRRSRHTGSYDIPESSRKQHRLCSDLGRQTCLY
jgi:hypothetical protein